MLSVTRLEAGQRQQPKHPRTREITECETGCSHFVGTLACREWYQHLNGSDSAGLGRTEEGREKTWEDRSAGRKVEARQPAKVVRWIGRQSADRELVVKTKACLAVVDASDPTCSRRGSLRGGAWMREVNRSEPLASLGKQGVPREGFATAPGASLPNQKYMTASPTSTTTQLCCCLASCTVPTLFLRVLTSSSRQADRQT